MMKGEAPALPPIGVPTCVRWAEHDPLFPYEWTDRLGETFTNLDLAMFGDVGHFFPIARIPIARHRRSRRSLRASAGNEDEGVGPPDATKN